jgi:hypothetical protein
MDFTPTQKSPEAHSLIDSLEQEWIKLPFAVMREVGPAAQTLGGLLSVTKKETFAAVAEIARRARVPVKTARSHLRTLAEHQWIENAGRGRTRRGAPRRTCTLRVTPRTHDALTTNARELVYGVLPWWACCRSANFHLKWSSRAVLSIVMARLMAINKAILDEGGPLSTDRKYFWALVEDFGGAKRFRFTLDKLESLTGLARHSVIAAKKELNRYGIVKSSTDQRIDGGSAAELLAPNPLFRIEIMQVEPRYCTFNFRAA